MKLNLNTLSFFHYLIFVRLENGDLFGWGNSEYGQFKMVTDDVQLATATRLPVRCGKIRKAAAAGSACAVLNGNFE